MYAALGTRILTSFLGGPTRDNSALALAEFTKAEQAAAERFRTRMAQRPANTSPSRALGDYAGTFRSEMYGDLTVTLENGVLMVRYPRAVEFKLWHFAYDTFLGTSATETAPGPDAAAVRFSLDPMGGRDQGRRAGDRRVHAGARRALTGPRGGARAARVASLSGGGGAYPSADSTRRTPRMSVTGSKGLYSTSIASGSSGESPFECGALPVMHRTLRRGWVRRSDSISSLPPHPWASPGR
jgi:hypothetical protein